MNGKRIIEILTDNLKVERKRRLRFIVNYFFLAVYSIAVITIQETVKSQNSDAMTNFILACLLLLILHNFYRTLLSMDGYFLLGVLFLLFGAFFWIDLIAGSLCFVVACVCADIAADMRRIKRRWNEKKRS